MSDELNRASQSPHNVFTPCEPCVQACIDALPSKVGLVEHEVSNGEVLAFARCRTALQALLPNPRRKAMEEALLRAIVGRSGCLLTGEGLQAAVDAVMEVKA